VDLSNREGQSAGGYSDHPLIRLAVTVGNVETSSSASDGFFALENAASISTCVHTMISGAISMPDVHSAQPRAFFMISFGSVEHSNFEMLSTIEPAAPSDEAPAVRPVALTSFASRPVKVRLRTPKVRSQVRAVMSTFDGGRERPTSTS
jgi:hypothetical protein